MFTAVGRRLALFNAVVLVAVLVVVGLSTYLFLDRRIVSEVDRELVTRASATHQLWTSNFAQSSSGTANAQTTSSSPTSTSSDDENESENDDQNRDDDTQKKSSAVARPSRTASIRPDG